MFGNYGAIQFFPTQSQCDYTYETFRWWLWLYFFAFVTIPFVGSLVFFLMTFRLIHKYNRIVKMKKAQFELEQSRKYKRSSRSDQIEDFIEALDFTLQPCNQFYYSHFIKSTLNEEEDDTNDFHVRTQLLTQFKYDTEQKKTITFFIILILNYLILFPVLVMHFYRAYNNTKSINDTNGFDNPSLIQKNTYTAFVWISYSLLVIKSLVCLIQNRSYRHAFYQAANCRGFSGSYEFQKIEKELNKVKLALHIDESQDKLQSNA
jgi:hypothetical protein